MRTIAANAGLAVALLAAVPAQAATRDCGTIRDLGPTGADPADGAGITAENTSCSRARSVTRRWFGPTRPTNILGYRCTDTISRGRQQVRCTKSSATIRFYLG
ncbi:MAG: hypothetical protein H0T15_05695 [Thermoleophilaceae bacterium]|nr:hypothetical protein [Thermoleophilaceae bacterium]